MIDKAQSRHIRCEIRSVFLHTWDPIGVENEPNAQNEYDSYIGVVYDMLVSGAPDSAIADYLFWAVHEHMGLDASQREDMLPTVAELKKINLTPHAHNQSFDL